MIEQITGLPAPGDEHVRPQIALNVAELVQRLHRRRRVRHDRDGVRQIEAGVGGELVAHREPLAPLTDQVVLPRPGGAGIAMRHDARAVCLRREPELPHIRIAGLARVQPVQALLALHQLDLDRATTSQPTRHEHAMALRLHEDIAENIAPDHDALLDT